MWAGVYFYPSVKTVRWMAALLLLPVILFSFISSKVLYILCKESKLSVEHQWKTKDNAEIIYSFVLVCSGGPAVEGPFKIYTAWRVLIVGSLSEHFSMLHCHVS